MNRLLDNGYIQFKNLLSTNQVNNLSNSIVDKDYIDNNLVKEFIDKSVKTQVDKQMKWNLSYGKFRFSNFSNLTDAGTFHGDIYNFTSKPIMPIYTITTYLDNATLEIIPGTHIDASYNTLNNRLKVNMKPGDVLLFNAALRHRGVAGDSGDRRILQIFDIFSDPITEKKHGPLYYSINTSNTLMGQMIRSLNSKQNITGTRFEQLHYYLVSKNLQYSIAMNDMSTHFKRGKYIGYVPGFHGTLDPKLLHVWNVNILTKKQNSACPNMVPQNAIITLLILLVIIFIAKRLR